MSSTTIKALWPGTRKEPRDLAELRNSWGAAPVVWDALSQRYLGTKPYAYGLGGEMDDLWELWKRTDIPKHQRAVLMLTFDRAYVTKANFARMANDIDAFIRDFPSPNDKVYHWPTIADLFRRAKVPAIGLHCTSVAEDPFRGEYDDAHDNYKPFDWSTAFDLYEELDALPPPARGSSEER